MKKLNVTTSIVIFLLTLLLLQLSSATEDKGIFQILDEIYIDNITNLPYSNGNPDKNIQLSGHIEGWIDIVGFDKMSKDNDIYYVPGNPEKYAIIQNEVWGKFKCDICSYSIKKTAQVLPSNNNTIAILDLKMTWYEKVCTKDGCSCIEHIEYASFSDTEKSPQIINSLVEPEINVIQYNNSLYENIGIQINPTMNITRLDVSLNDSSLTRTLKIGHVEKTNKGIYFANMSELQTYSITGKNISHFNDQIFINGNLSKINVTNIKISTSNLYETKYYTNYNISIEEFRPEKETIENPLLMSFWSILLVIFGGIFLTIRRM